MPAIILKCPVCLSKAKTHQYIKTDAFSRRLKSACTNVECGHTFESKTFFVRTANPSEFPEDGKHALFDEFMPKPGQLDLLGGDVVPIGQGSTDKSGFYVGCHVCLSNATIYSTKTFSALSKEHWCGCQNPDCCHTFVSHTTFEKTISPSALPVAADPHPELMCVESVKVAPGRTGRKLRINVENESDEQPNMRWINGR